jgi:hypothetical protein
MMQWVPIEVEAGNRSTFDDIQSARSSIAAEALCGTVVARAGVWGKRGTVRTDIDLPREFWTPALLGDIGREDLWQTGAAKITTSDGETIELIGIEIKRATTVPSAATAESLCTKKGRPPGTGRHQAADQAIAPFIADEVRSGNAPSIESAIRMHLDRIGGASPEAKIKRLTGLVEAELEG